jgi:hypothetical protein
VPVQAKGQMSGSIRRQGARTWQVRVFNRTARRYEYFTVRGDKTKAKAARLGRLAEIQKGSLRPPPKAAKITVAELTKEWLERKATTCEPKTVLQYEWCSKHILNARYGLGAAPVQTITVDDVQRFVDALVPRSVAEVDQGHQERALADPQARSAQGPDPVQPSPGRRSTGVQANDDPAAETRSDLGGHREGDRARRA